MPGRLNKFVEESILTRMNFVVVGAWMTLLFGSVESKAEETLCKASEVVKFSCAIKGSGKLVSVCSSPDLGRAKGYLQYRFGTHQRIELEFPSDTAGTQGKFSYSAESPEQLGEYEGLTFRNGDYQFTVQRWVRWSKMADSADYAGILVHRVGPSTLKEVADLKCKVGKVERRMGLEGIIDAAQ